MALTNFPNGLSSFGVPVLPAVPNIKPWATYYFVDASNFSQAASDGNDGLSPDTPLRTMGRAFELIEAKVSFGQGGSGSVICFIGNVAEQLVTPAGVFDVTVIGCGSRPRHADAFNGNSGYSAATWKTPASATAATALCRVLQQGWSFYNILWDGPSDAAALEFVRNAGSGTSERDASHFTVAGCRFAAGQNHISLGATSFTENLFNGLIIGSTFNDATAASIMTAGGVSGNRHQIIGNVFADNATHIDLPMTDGYIAENSFGAFTSLGVDLTGGATNVVTKNYMSGDYDAGYVGGTNDEWAGNFSMDLTSDEVGDNAITTAAPVA